VTLTLTAANYQSPFETQLHPDLPTIGNIFGEAGFDVVYFGKWHCSKGFFNVTTGKYVHDDISRYGFGMPGNTVSSWNGEPPLGTRGIGGFGGGRSNLDYYSVGNATRWLTDRIANGNNTNPFVLFVSIWNPHDSPVAFPGAPANASDFTQTSNAVEPKWLAGGYNESIFQPTDPLVQVPNTNKEIPGLLNLTTGYIYYSNETTIKPPIESLYLFASSMGLGPCLDDICRQKYVSSAFKVFTVYVSSKPWNVRG
jgi:arylsulfatase A-like enzyme